MPEQDREYLDIAIKKITFLKLLSDDFFEISSIAAKEEELELSTINVRNFLSDCILQQYAWIEQQKLQTDFQLPEEDVFLETNEHYLKRIIENIFSNIRKYVKSYVGVKLVCEKEQLMVVMENDLKEMDGIDTNRIFEAFYRGNARNNEGSGLGLYVVKCLAKRLGYEVCAECQEELFRIKVIVGYPNWWASIPMPIASFLEEYDFSGKLILPFCSHGGGRLGQSLTAIERSYPSRLCGQ